MSPFVAASLMMIASGSIHAVVNAIVKGGRARDAPRQDGQPGSTIMAARALTDGSSAIILLPAIAFVPPPHGAWPYLGASAVVHAVYLYAMIRAYSLADFSAAYPVLRGAAPLLTAIITLGIVGEPAHATTVAGIGLIAASMFLLVLGRHLAREALLWSLLTGSMTAFYTVADAAGVRAAPSIASYIVWDFVLIGTMTVTMFGLLSGGTVFRAAARQWRPSAIAGGLSIVTYGLALTALARGPTAALAALRETGMVTALAIAVMFLGERVTWQRIVAVLGILVGAALILLR